MERIVPENHYFYIRYANTKVIKNKRSISTALVISAKMLKVNTLESIISRKIDHIKIVSGSVRILELRPCNKLAKAPF